MTRIGKKKRTHLSKGKKNRTGPCNSVSPTQVFDSFVCCWNNCGDRDALVFLRKDVNPLEVKERVYLGYMTEKISTLTFPEVP